VKFKFDKLFYTAKLQSENTLQPVNYPFIDFNIHIFII